MINNTLHNTLFLRLIKTNPKKKLKVHVGISTSNPPQSSPTVVSPAAQMLTPHCRTSTKQERKKSVFSSIRRFFGIRNDRVDIIEPSMVAREEGEKREDEVEMFNMRTVRHVQAIDAEKCEEKKTDVNIGRSESR